MTTPPATPPSDSLVERKQRRARQRIVEAADELFAQRGFDDVSVTDIAARAEVGRTTFFRYFGDKTEVVFAKERAMLDAIEAAGRDTAVAAAQGVREAIEQLRPIVVDLCERAAEDLAAYDRRAALLDQHVELRARDALKSRQIATRLGELLGERGTAEATAVLAAQVALGCYETARIRSRSGGDLVREAHAAFDELLALRAG
ncbi:TetR/AcrR family transcriptional regulator [Promicromonospora thailandica]|uniref:TetR/AcrR family transcriptional regulator n=1 Tax=Promicromonospora thailandica TaxID=765201 RepID=UPI0020A3685E|nr:TetR family transcriptional regulator [Promicromonospora thailandica]BFF16623.1 TetR/AcrR family transcriptional regulator [Promicromonospora thailandica]